MLSEADARKRRPAAAQIGKMLGARQPIYRPVGERVKASPRHLRASKIQDKA